MKPLEHQDLGYLINVTARLLKQNMAAELTPLGLTPQQAAVILAVSAPGAALTITQAAARLGMDRPTMTGVVERLTKNGWIQATPNPADGRSRLINNTDKANKALPDIREASTRASNAVLDGFSDEDVERLRQLLNRIAESANADPTH